MRFFSFAVRRKFFADYNLVHRLNMNKTIRDERINHRDRERSWLHLPLSDRAKNEVGQISQEQ